MKSVAVINPIIAANHGGPASGSATGRGGQGGLLEARLMVLPGVFGRPVRRQAEGWLDKAALGNQWGCQLHRVLNFY